MFADKGAMAAPLRQFNGIRPQELQRQFKQMEDVRNQLAHTALDRRGELSQLADVIRYAEDILRRLSPSDEPKLRLILPNEQREQPTAGGVDGNSTAES